MAESFTISLAGQTIRVAPLFDAVGAMCRDYLTETTEPNISVVITPADIEAERQYAEETRLREGQPLYEHSDAYLETLAVYRKIADAMFKRSTLLFHGSAVARDGEAYLFTARSGTGKTTHTCLWLKQFPDAHVVNGDKPLLRIGSEGVSVCGTPWMGKENYGCNEELPLKAICIIERAEQNSIERIGFGEALKTLLAQSYVPGDGSIMDTLTLLGKIKNVHYFRLHCNMEPEAALVSYRGMQEEGIE